MNIILDTNYLADFLGQYFDSLRNSSEFFPNNLINGELAELLNYASRQDEEDIGTMVVSSALAFVEMCRKWNEIVNNRFLEYRLQTFIMQPPEWFDIAPVDEDLLPFFAGVPKFVELDNDIKRIEWTDAIHIATMFSRGNDTTMATTDKRIRRAIEITGGKLFNINIKT